MSRGQDRNAADVALGDGRDHAVFEAELSGKSLDVRLLGRLLGWLRPHGRDAWGSIALILAASGIAVFAPVVVSRVVIDGILMPSSHVDAPRFGMDLVVAWIGERTGTQPLMAACLLYASLIGSWAVLGHFHRVLLARAVLAALRDLRVDLFSRLETLPSSFYDKVAVGRVMTRVTNDVEVLFQLLAGLGVIIGELVPFFVALAVMALIYPPLAGLLLLAVPVVAFATWLFRRATRVVYRVIRNSVSALNQNLQENLAGVQVVQLHCREARNLARYEEINERNRGVEAHAVRLETLYGPFVDSLGSAALAVILWFGGLSALEGALTLGSVVLFAQYVDMLFRPIVALGEQYNVLYRAMASGERIFQALDWDEALREPSQPSALPDRLRGSLEFSGLTFGYGTGDPVLREVDLQVAPGETVAIVGPTGSGKTTLIRLLCRFYDLSHGSILIDGHDVRDLKARDVRRRIGVVLQDFHIFSGTVAENITLGDPTISRERIEEAARLVEADRFIRTLPRGYDTPLSERGQNLSHGQRQLLAFARVLAADPEILVLDEATASIDTETELAIQSALRKVTQRRTSILIAHRLQTIREADRIVVLHHGTIREVGTHDELIGHRGLYYTLHELQFQDDAA
jgi:ATP-binding cassette subfamily B multidrug efflux pump